MEENTTRPRSADLAMFDAVIADLNKLLKSLDEVAERSRSAKRATKKTTVISANSDKANRELEHSKYNNGSDNKSLHDENQITGNIIMSRPSDINADNIIKKQTYDSSTQAYSRISEDKVRLQENRTCFYDDDSVALLDNQIAKNDVTGSGCSHYEKFAVNSSNRTGNCLLSDNEIKQNGDEFTSPDRVAVVCDEDVTSADSENKVSLLERKTSEDHYKNGHHENSEGISRSSPVLVRRKLQDIENKEQELHKECNCQGTLDKKHNTAERRLLDEHRSSPFSTRSLSLKRVLTSLGRRSRGAKPKLKSVQSLPHRSNSTEIKDIATKEATSDTTHYSTRNFNISHTLSFKSGHKTAKFFRAKSFDYSNSHPCAIISEKNSNSEELYFSSSPEANSLLCYKKRKNSKDIYTYHSQNSTSSDSQTRESDSQGGSTDKMLHSLQKPMGVAELERRFNGGLKDITRSENERKLSTSKSLTDLVSLPTNFRVLGSHSKGDTPNSLLKPREEETIRRSTVGSSYMRNEKSTKTNIQSEKGANRHSFHLFKQQRTSPVEYQLSKSNDKWPSDNKLVKGTSFHTQLSSQYIDKNSNIAKVGSIKHRNGFPRATKSSGKYNMNAEDFDKKTERIWLSKENCVWCNMAGERVELQEVDLLSLSESECFALQKVAAQHLHDSDLCASFTIPKDEYKLMTEKKGFHLLKAKNKSKKQDHVFAIPLVRVVENDQLLRLQTIEQDNTACTHFDASQDASDSDSLVQSGQSPKVGRRDSSSVSESVFTSIDSPMSASPVTNEDIDHEFMTSSVSPKSMSAAPVRNTLRRRAAINTEIDPDQSKLLESLSESSIHNKKRSLLPPTMPQVPYVVQKCCAHLVKHGLDVTGIFRVPGSKKRVKQLREEFDRGVDVKVEDDYMAHDVAALFKEFFRDLPEALLTRELYQAFISTTKLGPADRLTALRCLVWLLPMPNRDTIQQLLSFLSTVAESSQDRVDANGKTICGNKMGISNLAMIFGPNILHRNKKTSSSNADAQYQVQSLERAEESTMVISVVEDMIRNQKELFLVPCETHDAVLRTLQESDPDALDVLLRRKAVNYARNGSPHTSSGQASDGSVSDEDEILSMDRFRKINANNNNSIKIPYVNGNDSSAIRATPTIIKEQILKSGLNTKTEIARPIPEKEQKAVDLLMDEISFSPPPFSKSISFSDADMKEILYRDVSPQKTVTATKNTDGDKTYDAVKIIKNDLHDNAHDFNHTDVNKKTSSRPVPKPRTHVTSQIQKGENSLKDMSQQSRRQAFSLNPRVSQTNTTEKGSKNGPVIDEDSTSGIADCSISYNSCNGDSVHSDHEIHNSVPALSNEIESRDLKIEQEDPPIRKRLPSTLNLRLNRTYGAQSHGAMHAVRIPKKRTEKNSNPENEVVYRQTKSSARNHPPTRRFSKDDMFATLERYQHRHEQRHCINYNKLLASNEEMV